MNMIADEGDEKEIIVVALCFLMLISEREC